MSRALPAPDTQDTRLAAFIAELQTLRGDLSYREIAAGAYYSSTTYWRVANTAVLHDWKVTEAFIQSSLDARDRRDGVERDEVGRSADLKRLKRQYDEVAPRIPAEGVAAVSGSAPLPASGETPHSALRGLRSWSGLCIRDLARQCQIARSTLADKLSGKSVLTSQEVYSIAFACVQAHQRDTADAVASHYVEHHRSSGEVAPRGHQLPAPQASDEARQRHSRVLTTPPPEVVTQQTSASGQAPRNLASLSAPVPPGFGSAAARVPHRIQSAITNGASGRPAGGFNFTQATDRADSVVTPATLVTREEFAQALVQLKRAGGMSNRALAARAGTAEGTIPGWFAGASLPGPDSDDFKRVLGVLGEAERYGEWCKAAARLRNEYRQDGGSSPFGQPSPHSDSREHDDWSTGASSDPGNTLVPGIRLECLGVSKLLRNGRPVPLPPRQLEILVLLALEPDGYTPEQLHAAVYGERPGSLNTVKADVSHLRRATRGEITNRRYMLTGEVSCDAVDLLAAIEGGDLTSALWLYRGPLLPGSDLPGVEQWRAYLHVGIRNAVLGSDRPEHAVAFGQRFPGDVAVHEHALQLLPRDDVRRAVVTARLFTARQG
ncbi:winged helix-turn-helix domain-containing protein [Nocardia salmonicida]|uniref:winged helix-turn-helix domain-containing protein n=1 Tax=Nocardia salmonicida TaxID=53431 RepID=UPI003CE8FCE7